jgi:hypothetical protein
MLPFSAKNGVVGVSDKLLKCPVSLSAQDLETTFTALDPLKLFLLSKSEV